MDFCTSRKEGRFHDEHHATNEQPTEAVHVSRHVQASARREAMTTEYVNIMEAVRCWIHAQKLRTRFPQPNRCEIAVSDLKPFLPGHLPGQSEESIEIRVATLKRQIQALEQRVQQLLTRSAVSRAQPSFSQHTQERTTGPLPRHLVSVLAFAQLHRIPEQKVHTHINSSLLPFHRGRWTDHDGQPVTMTFDAKGRQAFHHLYHETPWFVPCTRCLHDLPGHV
jgi:hypothetical protein